MKAAGSKTSSAPEAAITFITSLFEDSTVAPVYICSLPNERDDPQEPPMRRVSTRDAADITKFISKWDRPRRGLFFCIGTIANGRDRSKDNVVEIVGLHADVDFKSVQDSEAEVLAKLASLRYPPTLIIRSGNGLHAYWLFKEAITLPISGEDRLAVVTQIESALRQLADVVGGDMAVCEIARLMRLPGTHNTKQNRWAHVETLTSTPRRYELDDLEEWLAEQSPVVRRAAAGDAAESDAETNPFLQVANRFGFKPPLDVQQRLAAMSYMGVGDASVHQTQLAVTASLLTAGQTIDEVLDTVMAATRAAAGPYGARWNWPREEKAVRKMCETWLRKHPARPSLEQVRRAEESVNGEQVRAAGGAVVDLAARRQAKKPRTAKPDRTAVAAVVADGVIEAVRAAGQDILLTEGEVWLYSTGIWHVMTPADQQWLLTLVQTGFETLGEPGKNASLAQAWKRLTEHPDLFQREVKWAGGDVVVAQNGVLEIATGKFHAHAPHWYAQRKIGTSYEPGRACPEFIRLLENMFSDRPVGDQASFTAVIQAWIGSALAVGHLSREERKALILVGPSRTGKTELSRIIRLLIGDPIATPSVSEVSERFGLASLYGAAAWIRDDAINEGDDLDPQRFKTIVTGEPIDIERKHKPAVTGVELQVPVLLTTNALPRARDKSDAIFNRALVLEMTSVVSEQDAHDARKRAGVPRGMTLGAWISSSEGPGILNWALEGLRRLLDRGSYELPDSVRAAIQRFKDDNNPVGEWARTAVVKSLSSKVYRSDIMCAYHGWQREQDGDEARAFGARAFFPRLRAAVPWAGDVADSNGRRYVTGVALTDEGLQLWDLHNTGPQLKGGSKGISLSRQEVNKMIEVKKEDENAPRF